MHYHLIYQGGHHDIWCNGTKHIFMSGDRFGVAPLAKWFREAEITECSCDCPGRILNEDNLSAGEVVVYREKRYTTGNRGHAFVDLRDGNGEFIFCVPIKDVRLA